MPTKRVPPLTLTVPPDPPSLHLSWDDLACHDTLRSAYPADYRGDRLPRLVAAFEAWRAACAAFAKQDTPLIVISAYRTPAYNTQVGGEPNSFHVQGLAIDATPGRSRITVLDAALRAVEVAGRTGLIRGVGYYPDNGFVHIDVGERGPAYPPTRVALWRVRVIEGADGRSRKQTLGWSGTGPL